MYFNSFGFLVAATAIASASAQYDYACMYPDKAKEDLFEARNNIIWATITSFEGQLETPYVIHNAHEITMCQAGCAAYHTPGMMDPLTSEPPKFVVPHWGQNPYSILMCMVQCAQYSFLATDLYYRRMKNSYGFDVVKPEDQPEVEEWVNDCGDKKHCEGECANICAYLQDSSYNPYNMGSYLGVLIKNHFDTDGWNRQGDMQFSTESDEPVPCTASCRLFQDTSGYHPQIDPRAHPEFYDPMGSKYECEGDCRRWQPLQEGDDQGNLIHQEFVAPHIGKYAHTYLRNVSYDLEDPEYDLYLESLGVIDEVSAASGNETKKNAITLFDDKLKVRRVLQDAITEQFGVPGHMSFQEYLVFLIGISSAEIDGLVQAWAEKVKHDLVRPTTVIKHWDDDNLLTFGGDRNADGPTNIKARDFEAFIRVMPHGEFPSGSSCLCSTYKEFVDKWTMEKYNGTIMNFGNVYNDLTFNDMTELMEMCGESRLWGGMHYEAAIPAGVETCSGLGTLGVEWADSIRNGATFPNEWFSGTPRPDKSHC